MTENQLTFIDEQQKRAKIAFVFIACGCVGVLVYGGFVSKSEGLKNWRSSSILQTQNQEQRVQQRRIQPMQVEKVPTSPQPIKKDPSQQYIVPPGGLQGESGLTPYPSATLPSVTEMKQ